MAHARAVDTYRSLCRGEGATPRAVINMLTTFDIVTHPEFPDNILSPELRAAPAEEIDLFHDEIAEAIAAQLTYVPAPLFIIAQRGYGPISARVHQKVESALFDELNRAAANIDERVSQGLRRPPFGEWMEVSYVRSIYRRIEQTLGEGAARYVWPTFAGAYCALGVQLSESFPRMRPLAFAVFRVLSAESIRWNDAPNISQQAHNLAVTSGIE
jgi:hypothetical protein